MDKFSHIKRTHFIGIGGIGISAVAKMFLLEGKEVSGSDRASSTVTEELTRTGAVITIGQDAKNVPDNCDLVVYTVAISDDNPELAAARERGIETITYPETLRHISAEKYTIAVSGTHGKTTVTAMIASVFLAAGLDPTVIIGGLIPDPNSPGGRTNFIAGKSKYFIVEADEYKKSFHNLEPTILVINNLDADHLDFYKDLEDIQNSFRELAERVPEHGCIICDPHNPHVQPVIAGLKSQIISYMDHLGGDLQLNVPGEHNRRNAAAALAVADAERIQADIAREALQNFAGSWRRFEYKGETRTGALVYDDYAHNPTKVRSAIQGARERYPDRKIFAVFQPHQYSRTKELFNDFVNSFDLADEVLLVPIYAAREEPDPTISSEILAEALNTKGVAAQACNDFEEVFSYLNTHAKSGDIIMTIGAGDITQLSDQLVL